MSHPHRHDIIGPGKRLAAFDGRVRDQHTKAQLHGSSGDKICARCAHDRRHARLMGGDDTGVIHRRDFLVGRLPHDLGCVALRLAGDLQLSCFSRNQHRRRGVRDEDFVVGFYVAHCRIERCHGSAVV